MRNWDLRHSAGCLVAVNTYFEAPEKVAALILVAPAIVSPLVFKKGERGYGIGEEKQTEGPDVKAESQDNLFVRIWKGLQKLYQFVAGLVLHLLSRMIDVIRSICFKALTAVLRSAFGLMLVCLS